VERESVPIPSKEKKGGKKTHPQANQLPLSTREVRPPLINLGIQLPFHPLDMLLQPTRLKGGPKLSVGGGAGRVEVLTEGTGEHLRRARGGVSWKRREGREGTVTHLRVLRNDREAGTEGVEADLGNVDSVDFDLSTGSFDDAVQNLWKPLIRSCETRKVKEQGNAPSSTTTCPPQSSRRLRYSPHP
jgi:hypothetical protein